MTGVCRFLRGGQGRGQRTESAKGRQTYPSGDGRLSTGAELLTPSCQDGIHRTIISNGLGKELVAPGDHCQTLMEVSQIYPSCSSEHVDSDSAKVKVEEAIR